MRAKLFTFSVIILTFVIIFQFVPFKEENTKLSFKLPRRKSKFSLSGQKLNLTSPPQWVSCPDATSRTSIWSMATTNDYALYSLVLGLSIKDSWNSTSPLPDLRMIIIHPSNVDQSLISALSRAGWGLCYIPRLEYLEHPTIRFKVFSKHVNG